jgi:hypothetical protein
MTDEETPPEHPLLTVADQLGAKVAEHVHAARLKGGEAETARKYAATEAFATMMHGELKPALVEAMRPIIEAMPDDHPLKQLAGLAGSPGNVVLDALLDSVVFIAAFAGAFKQIPQIMAENIVNDVNAKFPNVPLSPSQAANLWQEAYNGKLDLGQEALFGGIDAERYEALKYLAGVAPAPQELFEMFRRGIITYFSEVEGQNSVELGLYQGQTKQSWVGDLAQLAYVWPAPIDFVNAAVREQIPYDTAARWAAATGLDLNTAVTSPPESAYLGKTSGGAPTGAEGSQPGSFFDLLFDVAGRPPGPEEMARMAHRGIIPWTGTGPKFTTFQQGIAESDLKTKWTESLRELSTYIPSNGEITGWVRHGFVSAEDAWPMYRANGVTHAVAELMVHSALTDQLAEDRRLAKGEILAMYQNQLITPEEATAALEVIGFHGEIGKELLRLADFRRESQAYGRIISEIGRQVLTGKVSLVNAHSTLAAMGVPPETIKVLTDDWKLARQTEVPTITAGEIATSVYYGVEKVEEGMEDLEALGYTKYNAWRLLSNRLHGPAKPFDGIPARPKGPQL